MITNGQHPSQLLKATQKQASTVFRHGFLQRRVATRTPVLYNLDQAPSESTDVASENPEIVHELRELSDSTRKEFGEFMQRGSAQRPTGSLFPKSVTKRTGSA